MGLSKPSLASADNTSMISAKSPVAVNDQYTPTSDASLFPVDRATNNAHMTVPTSLELSSNESSRHRAAQDSPSPANARASVLVGILPDNKPLFDTLDPCQHAHICITRHAQQNAGRDTPTRLGTWCTRSTRSDAPFPKLQSWSGARCWCHEGLAHSWYDDG